MEPKRCNTLSVISFEILEIVQCTSTTGELREFVFPARLVLVAVGEVKVRMEEIEGCRKVLEAEDYC
jgi:hypothetical protein